MQSVLQICLVICAIVTFGKHFYYSELSRILNNNVLSCLVGHAENRVQTSIEDFTVLSSGKSCTQRCNALLNVSQFSSVIICMHLFQC